MITRGRVTIAAVIVALLAVLIGAVLLTPRTSSAPLDPESAAPGGARAVAQVLDQQGVDVSIVRRANQIHPQDAKGATVVLTRPELLSKASLARTMAGAEHARRLVIVDPDPTTLEALDLPVIQLDSVDGTPDSLCTIPWLKGLRLSHADIAYAVDGIDRTCFGEGGQGAVAILPKRGRAPETVLLGSRAALTNNTVTDADNAAVTLRILGANSHLVWLAPTLATADNPAASGPKWPDWFHPAIWLGGAVVIVVMLWRGRRFGRLAVEPLPVLVPAGETTRSRGRLYRKARDYPRAAAVLRVATRGRLARYLGLAPNGRPETLVARSAQASDNDPLRVADLLYGADPPDETSMTSLAQDLEQLERQVRR
jgi:hypothetical protein